MFDHGGHLVTIPSILAAPPAAQRRHDGID